jgi:hypothetical protein
VGNSWVGRWVNFGALATTSNLKNTYGSIRYQRDSATITDTGSTFWVRLWAITPRFGIGQLLTTGSNIGVGCNVYGGAPTARYVPSFSWGGAGGWQEHQLELFLRTVETTLSRRNLPLRQESEAVLRDLVSEHCQ